MVGGRKRNILFKGIGLEHIQIYTLPSKKTWINLSITYRCQMFGGGPPDMLVQLTCLVDPVSKLVGDPPGVLVGNVSVGGSWV